MEILITIIHVLVCLFLITVILLQSGSAGDISSAFGGLGSQTAFGPRGAQTALGKATITCAVVFMLTSVTLAIMAARSRGNIGSVFGSTPATQTVPAKKK